VRFSMERLIVADAIAITLATARVWRSPLRVGAYRRDGSADAAALIVRDLLCRHMTQSNDWSGASEFLAQALGLRRSPTMLTRPIAQSLGRLAPAARTGNAVAVLAALDALVGLGPGLTPAGDDFIVGWLAGLSLVADTDAKVRFLRAIRASIDGLRGKTTSISAQHLDDACALMFSERLSDLCVAIALGSPEPVLAAKLSAQLAVGATSGADAAAGLMFAVFDCDVRADDLRGRM
jgi:Protein of unknown function (DUF2877)